MKQKNPGGGTPGPSWFDGAWPSEAAQHQKKAVSCMMIIDRTPRSR
jgi:hypothetical protein